MSPDVTSYGALVSSCEKDAEWQLALHFLREFQSFCHEKIGGKTENRRQISVWKDLGILGFSNCEPRFEARTKVPELLQEKDWPRKNTTHLLFVVSTKCACFWCFFAYPTCFSLQYSEL